MDSVKDKTCFHHFHINRETAKEIHLSCCDCPINIICTLNYHIEWNSDGLKLLTNFINAYYNNRILLYNALETIHFYVHNMLLEGRRDKIRNGNVKFQQKLGCLSEAESLLGLIGFTRIGDFYELVNITETLQNRWKDILTLVSAFLSAGHDGLNTSYGKSLPGIQRAESFILEVLQCEKYERRPDWISDIDFYEKSVESSLKIAPAYGDLGCTPDMSDIVLLLAVDKGISEYKTEAEACRVMDALENLAKGRRSILLEEKFGICQAQGFATTADLTKAYVSLGTNNRGLDDEMLLSLYRICVSEDKDTGSLQRSLFMIAVARKSIALMDALKDDKYPVVVNSKEYLPVGLQNIGNTCYLNSLLQCFFSFEKLKRFVLEYSAGETRTDSEKCLLDLQTLFKKLESPESRVAEPSRFLADHLVHGSQTFGSQQDITESMESLITLLENILSKTVIRDMFYGETKQILSLSDGRKLENIELFASLILDAGRAASLSDALDKYMARSAVDFGEKDSRANRMVFLKKLPDVLFIQLQRAVYNRHKKETIKSNHFVSFPEFLNVSRYCQDFIGREEFEGLYKEITEIDKTLAALCTYPNHGNLTGVELASQLYSEFYPSHEAEDVDVIIQTEKENMLHEIMKSVPNQHSEKFNAILARISNISKSGENDVNALRERRRILVEKLEHLQSLEKDQKSYRLHAVFMHQGDASFGHYWIYIWDNVRNLWFQYNDANVSIIDAEVVYRDTTGQNSNAYCLVYTKE